MIQSGKSETERVVFSCGGKADERSRESRIVGEAVERSSTVREYEYEYTVGLTAGSKVEEYGYRSLLLTIRQLLAHVAID
jgi:hypothetical protein